MLQGKTIVLGVTGSIAAYKSATLASLLIKQHADVHVIMTQNAMNFIHPTTFETLTGNKCLVDTFDRNFEFHVAHVNLAQQADLVMIAPATANVIGKLAHGIADDMLTTTAMASEAPMYLAPAMNTNMYNNPVVQENLIKLQQLGKHIIEPSDGMLACRDIGKGKMPEPEVLLEYIMAEIAWEKDLLGKKVLITAGPTQEAIDPVRYITNHSTGKMGYAIAENAMRRGAEVTVVSGPCTVQPPAFIKVISVQSAQEMNDAVKKEQEAADFIVMSAAVADYCPKTTHQEKMKKSNTSLTLDLEQTIDILDRVGKEKRNNQFVCGFSMETTNLIENSKKKLVKKNADMIVANNLAVSGAGFGTDTNVVTLITKDHMVELPLLNKKEVASRILDSLIMLSKER